MLCIKLFYITINIDALTMLVWKTEKWLLESVHITFLGVRIICICTVSVKKKNLNPVLFQHSIYSTVFKMFINIIISQNTFCKFICMCLIFQVCWWCRHTNLNLFVFQLFTMLNSFLPEFLSHGNLCFPAQILFL